MHRIADTLVTQRYGNSRPYIRLIAPSAVVCFFAARLYAAILDQRRTQQKDVALVHRCMIGMAGQIAVLLWLRAIGLDAKMLLPAAGADPGWDIELGNQNVTIDVKTACFSDARTFDEMTGGDRMRLPRSSKLNRLPDFYFLCVWSSRVSARELSVDIAATIPSGAVKKWPKPISTPHGVRLRDIAPDLNTAWFAEVFADAIDSTIQLDFLSAKFPTEIESVSAWTRDNAMLFTTPGNRVIVAPAMHHLDVICSELASMCVSHVM